MINKWFAPVVFGTYLAFSCVAHAADRNPVSLGFEGGMTFANATSTAAISSSSRTGFLGGAALDILITRQVSFQPELMFVQRGTSLVDTTGIKLTAVYDNIEVPLLMKVGLGESIHPYFFGGPVTIFNVSNRLYSEIAGQPVNLKFNPSAINFALDVGAGVDLGAFFANLRYSLGLLDIDANHVGWRSRGIQLLIGFKIGEQSI